MINSEVVPTNVNNNTENILETDVPIIARDHSDMEKDVNDIPEDPIELGEYVSDDDQNDASSNVNENIIDNVEEVIHVVIEYETSKSTPKRSKRSVVKKMFVLKPKMSTTTKKYDVSSNKGKVVQRKSKSFKEK